MDRTFEALKAVLSGVRRNVALAEHVTFKIGGSAKYFVVVKNKEELFTAIAVAKKLNIPFFSLGGGSNLLVADKGFNGLVIKINNKNVFVRTATIVADAGLELKNVVDISIKKSLKGLEWAGGLPGTFGGAVRGNAGAFGGEMKDSVKTVWALDGNFKLKKFNHDQCHFAYRNTIFKEKNWTIVSAEVSLKKGNRKKLRAIADSHVAYRKEKHPLEYPNAGSIFKNVPVEKVPEEYKYLFMDKVKVDPFAIVPAAWLIIAAGLAGKKAGRAQISKKHSNYIVNLGGAKAKDVLKLIALVKKTIKKKYGIVLEQEIQYLE